MSKVSDNHTVTSVQARKALLKAFDAKRPVFLWGPPGIGKSEVVAEVTEELGGFMIDLRMAQMEPTDIRGIPFFNRDMNKMDWAPPIDLPDEELASQYPIIVLFLDEMNSAPPAVQAAGYQLVLNRRVGKYKMPDNVVIVAAGNRDSDKGVTYRPPAKLENLIRGYTGGLGVNMLRLLDPVFGGELVKPGQGLANAPIIGGIFQPEDASGIINAAYNTANELEAISKTYKRLELEDPDEAEKYLDKKLIEIDSASDAGRFKQYMGALTKEEREIRADKTLSPAEKSQYLKDLRQEKIEASKEFRQMILETKRQAA